MNDARDVVRMTPEAVIYIDGRELMRLYEWHDHDHYFKKAVDRLTSLRMVAVVTMFTYFPGFESGVMSKSVIISH